MKTKITPADHHKVKFTFTATKNGKQISGSIVENCCSIEWGKSEAARTFAKYNGCNLDTVNYSSHDILSTVKGADNYLTDKSNKGFIDINYI